MLQTLESVDSTNLELARRWRAGTANHGDMLRARHQTGGRGRMGRTFMAEPDEALLLSTLYVAEDSPQLREHAGWFTFATALAMRQALRVLGCTAELKWPNDLYVSGRKLGGVLGEALDPAEDRFPLILGIGVNTSATTPPSPEATSLAMEGLPHDEDAVLTLISAFRAELEPRLAAANAGMTDMLHAELTGCCLSLGRRVGVTTHSGMRIEGTALEIAPSGALIVDTPSGPTEVAGADADLI